MKLHTRHVVALIAVGLCLVASSSEATPNSNSFDKGAPLWELRRLSAEWWQWALSIPTPVNPLFDGTKDPPTDNCMIGQRGPTWFLAGVGGGGAAVRTCTLPEGKELFFPAINNVVLNSPNVCGQGSEDDSVKKLRAALAPLIDNVSVLEVTLDHKPIHHLHRVESDVFDVTMPEDNLFVEPCAPNASPAGVYSPAVGDGIYAFLQPLHAGTHYLHIHVTSRTANGDPYLQDTNYKLVVVPVKLE